MARSPTKRWSACGTRSSKGEISSRRRCRRAPITMLATSMLSRRRATQRTNECTATMKSGHSEIRTDHEALDKAIREGVTRDKRIGQGNGLYGSWRITQLSGGSFEIHAGNASLNSWPDAVHIRPEAIPFMGTPVV